MGRKSQSLRERLLTKFVKDKRTGCWNWIGNCTNGYGIITLTYKPRRRIQAHRASWIVHKGTIPQEMQVLHLCNNPACINPKHLQIGTQQDNIDYMMSCGRKKWIGSEHPKSKITKEDVQKIRNLASEGFNHCQIANMFPLSRRHICSIVNRRVWRHVK